MCYTNYINIGSSPADETCAQLGSEDYKEKAKSECHEFINLIREKLGVEPTNSQLVVKGFSHDYGIYYEVVCYYDENCPDAVEYAHKCESQAPKRWKEKWLTSP